MTSPPRGEVGLAVHEVRDTSSISAVMQVEVDLVQSRFARGCRCFFGRHGDEVVSFGWLATGVEWIGELELEIRPGPNEGYIWNCATDPRHRRKGFFRALVTGIANQGHRDGLKTLWIGTLDIPAAKALADLGFAPALRFTSVWLSGTRWLRVRRAETADQALSMAAREVLAIGGRPLRLGSSMKRSEHRVH